MKHLRMYFGAVTGTHTSHHTVVDYFPRTARPSSVLFLRYNSKKKKHHKGIIITG